MTKLPIPITAEDFTPDWVTAALQSSGALGDERVTAVEASPVGEGAGFLGSLARLAVTYDRPRAGAPATVVAKFPALIEVNRELAVQYQVYEREARFFNEIKATITAMPTPEAFYALISKRGRATASSCSKTLRGSCASVISLPGPLPKRPSRP